MPPGRERLGSWKEPIHGRERYQTRVAGEGILIFQLQPHFLLRLPNKVDERDEHQY